MPSSHRIRLRGPWQALPLEEAGAPAHDAPPEQWLRVTLPHRAAVAPFGTAAAVCYQRRFNKPTGLGDAETVWLVVEAFAATANVRLNDFAWPPCSAPATPLRIDITSVLRPANLLSITVSDASEVLLGDVALEIESA